MNQNIKNTLYRFTTMRVPQAVKEDVKENFFVSRPVNQSNSKFFGMEPFTTVTEGVVAAHNPVFNTMDNLKTEFGTFYDFAIWLTRNRMTVTETEARAAFNSVQKYKTGIRKTEDATVLAGLWNDLHYYALTLKNSKVRDAIISILTANDFYFKVISKTSSMTEEFVRGVAQARVILDLKPVVKENPPKKSGMPGKEEKTEILKRHHFLTAKANLYEISQRKKEILKAKEIFEQGEARKRKEADADYEEAVKAAYAAATYTERVVTDPETSKTSVVKEYTNLVLPDYADFYVRPADELTITTPKSYYSQNSISFVSQLKTDYEYLTYDEILSFISKETEIQNGKLLENSSKPKSLVVFNGIPFQKKSSQPQNLENLSYLAVGLIPLPQKDQYYMVIENLDADQIASAEYTLTKFPINGTRSEIEDTSVNVLQLDLPISGTTLLFDDKVEIQSGRMSLSATLVLTNGDELTFEVNEKSLETFIKGVNVQVEVEKIPSPSDTQIQVNARKIYGLTQLGIADYRKVEQEVCCYVPGEVSHIENIMAREYKSRSSTRRKMTELTETTTREMESEQLTDTTMVDRFEMNQEIAFISAQDTAIGVNAGVSYGTGNMNAFVNGSFASNTSTEESNSQAITHAKEITERALDRVVQKVKEERIKKVVEEFTDSNVHEYDNTKGDNHISGVYRWVDKIYNNKLINYGKRLMYEFMIPEPSSFHNEAILSLTNSGDVEQLPPPIDPRYAGDESLWLDTDNFVSISKFWASYYNAEIAPMPAESIVIGKEITHGNADGGLSLEPSVINHEGPSSVRTDLELPEEYIVKKVHFKFVTTPPHGGSHNHFLLLIGNEKYETGDEFFEDTYIASGQDLPSYYKGKLPVSFAAWDLGGFALNLSIFCELSEEAIQAWKVQTFNAIIEKYEEAKKAYDEKMAGLNQVVEEKVRLNPGFYRKIEKDVLRKNCMAYLISEKELGLNGFINNRTSGNDTQTIAVKNDAKMEQYASRVKFLEQAFEWDIMSYYFYPFYWAEKSTWSEKYQVQNDDPLFRAFLQSGMARVIVTVRPGFEEAVNWFIATGQVWNGGQVPVINDENFLDIVAEIREPEGEVEETWETRVPTSLTVIQAGTIGLDVTGLPCNEECSGSEENPIEQHPEGVFLENEKTTS